MLREAKGDSGASNSEEDADLAPKVENGESKPDVKVKRPPSANGSIIPSAAGAVSAPTPTKPRLKKSKYYKYTHRIT